MADPYEYLDKIGFFKKIEESRILPKPRKEIDWEAFDKRMAKKFNETPVSDGRIYRGAFGAKRED